jgi:hypothetical protein
MLAFEQEKWQEESNNTLAGRNKIVKKTVLYLTWNDQQVTSRLSLLINSRVRFNRDRNTLLKLCMNKKEED